MEARLEGEEEQLHRPEIGEQRSYSPIQRRRSPVQPHVIPPQSPSRPPETPTTYLDGLRGLAALFVFIQHYIGAFDANAHEHGFGQDGKWYYLSSFPFIRILFSGGNAGVSIFFVLSGYVLSKAPLRLLKSGRVRACSTNLVSAVIRRPMRLYLPPLVITFVYAIILHAPFPIVPISGMYPRRDSLFAEIGHWVVQCIKFFNPFQTHGSNKAWFTYNLVMWTIPIELKGSMLTYALTAVYAFIDLPPATSTLLLFFAAFGLLQLGGWTMACFILGLILSILDTYSLDIIPSPPSPSSRLPARFTTPFAQSIVRHISFLVGYYLLCQPSHAGSPEYSLNTPGWNLLTRMTPSVYDKNQYYHYWHSWGAALLVHATLRLGWLQGFLNTRPLRYLGRVSFMLYLVHLPLQAMLGDRISRLFGKNYMGAEPSVWDDLLWVPDIGPTGIGIRFLLSTAVLLPIDLVVADFCTKFVDTPTVRLGKKFARRLGLGRDGRWAAKESNEGSAFRDEEVVELLLPVAQR